MAQTLKSLDKLPLASGVLKRSYSIFLFLTILLLMMPNSARAQAWSGILDPSRAVDWRNGGASFTIPSGSWTQCGATLASTSTAAQINAAIASCTANHYVLLGAGTFNLAGCISWAGHSHVALRGAGPLLTILKFSSGCNGPGGTASANIHMTASANNYDQAANVQPGGSNSLNITGTAGSASGGPTGANLYPQGATQITVNNIGSDTPQVGALLFIDQVNDEVNNAGVIQCENTTAGACSGTGTNSGRGTANSTLRGQVQVVKLVSCSPNCRTSGATYTITPGLYAYNMRSSQSPGAWWNNGSAVLVGAGLENLTIDANTDGGSIVSQIDVYNAYQCWVTNVRAINSGGRNDVYLIQSAQIIFRSDYFFGSVGKGNGSGYGFDPTESSDFLLENIIFDQVPAPWVFENSFGGNVMGYNYWHNVMPGNIFLQGGYSSHDPGSGMNLFEGNNGTNTQADNQHGNSPLATFLRNHYEGNQPVPNNVTCAEGGHNGCQAFAVNVDAIGRGFSFVGNVLGIGTCVGGTFAGLPADENSQCTGGTAGGISYHLSYEISPNVGGSTTNCGRAAFAIGWGDGVACTNPGPPAAAAGNDNTVATTMMRWGNCDSVTGTCRFVNGEVPTSATGFLNALTVPATHTIPASFYYNSKPAWYKSAYGNPPFPFAGPDVTGGDLVTIPTGVAYRNPARLCYENTSQDSINYPGMPIISFDASVCYGTGTASGPPPAPPTNLSAAVN